MKKVWQNKLLKGSFAMILLSVTNVAFGEVSAKDFSAKNPPHLPPANVAQFEDGRDYFSYQEPIEQAKRSDRKIPIQFFFDYDCRVCSSAQDILQLYSQIRPNKVALDEYPVATNEAKFSATIFYTIYLTEEYGVFTFPYVVVGGKYVLTASTLYNDDYGVAVLDFLVNKLEQERKK